MFKTKLAKQVKNALLNNIDTQDAPIEVMDNNGVITLSGTVRSGEVRQRASEIAKSESGVISVINDVTVEEEVLPGSVPTGAVGLGVGGNQITFAPLDW